MAKSAAPDGGGKWGRRNAAAKAKGYKDYYDYRVHNYGRIPAGQPAPKGEARARLRGHRGAADLRRAVGEGALVSVAGHSERDPKTGQYRWVELTVVDERGKERTFRVAGKQLKRDNLERLVDDLEQAGAVLSPSPSLDIRRMVTKE